MIGYELLWNTWMTLDAKTDEQLMIELGNGHTQALALLVQRYQHKAMATAYRLLERWDVAEDITQEAFIRIHKAAGNYQVQAKFSTWFYRIVGNLCMDELRRRQRQTEAYRVSLEKPSKPETADDPVHIQATSEKQQAVRQALAALNERERTAVVLHRFEGLSHKQIAQINDCSESAVESLLVRAYRKLRQELKNFKNK
jgi:RNA polymerase sigma-70 factor, ECF subfamily